MNPAPCLVVLDFKAGSVRRYVGRTCTHQLAAREPLNGNDAAEIERFRLRPDLAAEPLTA